MVVQDLNGGHRHLGGVEPGPDVAAEAVQHGLDVDLADPLQRAREEGIHGHKFARGIDLDVSFAVLGVEALQRLDLLLSELDLPLSDRLPPASATGGAGSAGHCGARRPAPRLN